MPSGCVSASWHKSADGSETFHAGALAHESAQFLAGVDEAGRPYIIVIEGDGTGVARIARDWAVSLEALSVAGGLGAEGLEVVR